MKNTKLWYKSPARDWLEGLPIGTGRLAAMVSGSYKRDKLALNHEWLWKGLNRERDNEKKSHLLPGVRDLILAGKYDEGTIAGNDAFGGGGGVARAEGRQSRVDPYIPAGDLYLEFNHDFIHSYRRELDLNTGCVTVSYTGDRRRFKRQYLAHLTEDLILVRITADGIPFSCSVWLDRVFDPDCMLSFANDANILAMTGAVKNGVEFQVQCSVRALGGELVPEARDKLLIRDTEELILAVDIGTSAKGGRPADECNATKLSGGWADLFAAHTAEYGRHYGGFHLDVEAGEPENIPTDERLRMARAGADDSGLVQLYFNFGRYLLCASSANAELPANLQGKWNEDINPPWQCDCHHDINIQMNYWMAESTGMQDYAEALLRHIERFAPHAEKAAKDIYGCDGVWYPIQTDAWGRATPESYGWAVWIGAAAWLGQHMWWHYEYGQDAAFLSDRCYPFLKKVAAFYESYLIEDSEGTLQIVPSQSPENRFVGGGALPVTLCVSAAMDVELAWDALTHAAEAARLLDVDLEKQKLWRDMISRLPKLKIGSKGQLLEWNEEFEEVEPGHRHCSHLFALHPGEQICPDSEPALFKAAEKSLELRMAAFGGHTGWSRAWVSCFYARLGHGDKALEHLRHLITDFATDSLLDLHPPRIFQIDGNLGGAAAVVEMIFQSYHGILDFLPALPGAWPNGRVSGLRGRGGFSVDMEWKEGKLCEAMVCSVKNGECAVRKRGRKYTVRTENDALTPVTEEKEIVRFNVTAGKFFRVSCE